MSEVDPENEKMPEVLVHLSPEDPELEKKVPIEILAYLSRNEELLASIRFVAIMILAVMIIFGLVFAIFIFYDMVVQPPGSII